MIRRTADLFYLISIRTRIKTGGLLHYNRHFQFYLISIRTRIKTSHPRSLWVRGNSSIQFPLEQGLRLIIDGTSVHEDSFYPYSIRTRIKTGRFHRRRRWTRGFYPYSIRTRIFCIIFVEHFFSCFSRLFAVFSLYLQAVALIVRFSYFGHFRPLNKSTQMLFFREKLASFAKKWLSLHA